jgi:hypothetical protein
MRSVHPRRGPAARLCVALVAVATTATAAAGLAAAPAAAAEPGYFEVVVPVVTIGGEGSPGKAVPIMVMNSGATGATATFSLAELAGIAEAEVDSELCEASGDEITCDFPDAGPDEQYEIFLPLILRPASGAKAGDSGALRWRTEADNDADRDGFVPVTVADGVDLVVTSGGETIKDVKPGDTAAVPIAFGNAGNVTAPRIRLFVFASPGIKLTQYDNCEYVVGEGPLEDSAAQCDIDESLAPGEGLAGPFGATPEDNSPLSGEVTYIVEPLDEDAAELPLAKGERLRPGSGEKLTLHRKAAARTTAAPVEIDDADNLGSAFLLVDITADLAAIGATLHGAVGDTVTATVGLTNLGPATLSNRAGGPAANFLFTVPPGTRVVQVPDECLAPDTTKTPGAAAYLCGSDFVFAKGDKLAPTFKLKITEVVEGAEGTVQAVLLDGSTNLRFDKNTANNTAKVVVNPAAGGGDGGTGGGLPVTGVQVGAIAGGGAVLLAAGVVLFLFTRRRRVVLVADEDAGESND